MKNSWPLLKRSRIIASALLRRALGPFVFIGLFLLLSGTGLVSPLLGHTTASALAQVTPVATMVVGTASGAAGEQVTLNISLDTRGATAQSARLNLAFDGATLTGATGGTGAALPAAWHVSSHSPAPGDLRFLMLDLTGQGQPLNGPILTATFTIDPGAPAGDVPVTAVLVEVRDHLGTALSVAVTNGAVTVGNQPPDATMVIGTASGAAGDQVTLKISLDTAGSTAQSAQLNLAFDGATLTSATGGTGAALPAAWDLASHSPAPGELRILTVDLTGQGQPLNGPIFTATFTIDPGSTAGDVPVTAVLVDVHDDSGAALSVGVTNGVVTVGNQPPVVNSGPDINVTQALLTISSLNGTVVDDGLPNSPGAVTTTWSQVSGPSNVAFADPSVLKTTATFSMAGTHVLRLTAHDGDLSAFHDVAITVIDPNQPPTVDVVLDTTIPFAPRSSVSISGVVNDDGLPNLPGGVTHSWTKFSGRGKVIITDPASLTTAASFKRPGIYVLRLTADDSEHTAFGDLTVTVKRVYGGASLNGKFDIRDILLVIDWLLGRIDPPALGTEAFTAADVDGDSVVKLRDVMWMVFKLMGNVAEFPAESSPSPKPEPPGLNAEVF